MKRLIAQSPQLGELVPNDVQLNDIENANNNFDKTKLYKITGGQGVYGCISYQDVKNPNDKINLFITEVYVSLDAHTNKDSGNNEKSIVFITRPFLGESTFGEPIEIKETLSPNVNASTTGENEQILHVNGMSLVKLPNNVRDFDTAMEEAQEKIQKQFKDVIYK